MSKKKSTVQVETVKSDVVLCAEAIIGHELNIKGNRGSDYTSSLFSLIRKEGNKLDILKFDEPQRTTELQIIVLPGRSEFNAVVVKNGKVTLSPSVEITKDTQYQVVERYVITSQATASKTEEVPVEPTVIDGVRVFLDGDKYCAVDDATFINLQESPAAFGDTIDEAIANYKKHDVGGK